MAIKIIILSFYIILFGIVTSPAQQSQQIALTNFSGDAWNDNDNETLESPHLSLDEDQTSMHDDDKVTVPVIEHDLEKLPPAVKQMRQKIIDAAKSGNVDNLKNLLGSPNDPTELSVSDNVQDPIKFIKEQSADGEGLETLAILIDLLNTGYVHLDSDKEEEIYVWPYFIAIPLDKLTKAETVEIFQIMTAGDLEQMKEIGTYSFYRIGITPDGKWQFFMTGD